MMTVAEIAKQRTRERHWMMAYDLGRKESVRAGVRKAKGFGTSPSIPSNRTVDQLWLSRVMAKDTAFSKSLADRLASLGQYYGGVGDTVAADRAQQEIVASINNETARRFRKRQEKAGVNSAVDSPAGSAITIGRPDPLTPKEPVTSLGYSVKKATWYRKLGVHDPKTMQDFYSALTDNLKRIFMSFEGMTDAAMAVRASSFKKEELQAFDDSLSRYYNALSIDDKGREGIGNYQRMFRQSAQKYFMNSAANAVTEQTNK